MKTFATQNNVDYCKFRIFLSSLQYRGSFLKGGEKSMIISLVIEYCKIAWFTNDVCGMQEGLSLFISRLAT